MDPNIRWTDQVYPQEQECSGIVFDFGFLQSCKRKASSGAEKTFQSCGSGTGGWNSPAWCGWMWIVWSIPTSVRAGALWQKSIRIKYIWIREQYRCVLMVLDFYHNTRWNESLLLYAKKSLYRMTSSLITHWRSSRIQDIDYFGKIITGKKQRLKGSILQPINKGLFKMLNLIGRCESCWSMVSEKTDCCHLVHRYQRHYKTQSLSALWYAICNYSEHESAASGCQSQPCYWRWEDWILKGRKLTYIQDSPKGIANEYR